VGLVVAMWLWGLGSGREVEGGREEGSDGEVLGEGIVRGTCETGVRKRNTLRTLTPTS
jgi:hypothetical protein